jgi:hypothetical protein
VGTNHQEVKDMTVAILRPTEADLVSERERVLDTLSMGEADLRARADEYLLTAEEARVLRRIDEIDFLLGDDE